MDSPLKTKQKQKSRFVKKVSGNNRNFPLAMTQDEQNDSLQLYSEDEQFNSKREFNLIKKENVRKGECIGDDIMENRKENNDI